MIKKSFAGTLN